MFHLPTYSYPPAVRPPTVLKPLRPPTLQPPAEIKQENQLLVGKQTARESKVVQLLSTGLEGKGVLEVPGVGKKTASKFSNPVVEGMFGGKILTALDLYQRYTESKSQFVSKLKAIGVTQTNINRIISTFDKI